MSGRLAENVTYFARALRAAGLPVGPGHVVDAVAALEGGGVGSREDFYWVLHAVFVSKREHSILFDQAFRIFWRRRALIEKLIAQMSPLSPGAPHSKQKPEAGALRVAQALLKDEREDRPPPPPKQETEFTARLTVSDREVLQDRDFAQMSVEEIAKAKRLIADLVLPDDAVPTRRFRPDPRGRMADLRSTLRTSLRTGGIAVTLARRSRRERHPPVVALVDISGSMAEYSRLFLHFLHALGETRPVHAFVFATRLTNISRELRARDPDDALARAAARVRDWEGGTRLADALHAFNRDWSRRVLTGGAVALLFTDGLERQVTPQLGFEMDRLNRSCRRLIWLNPLLRYEAFQAKASGIAAMLPHVDEFRAMHSLAAMGDLVRALDASRTRDADPRRWLQAA